MNADGPWIRLHLLRSLEIGSLDEVFLTIFRDLKGDRVKSLMLMLTTILSEKILLEFLEGDEREK